ncbi:MAG: hypothetical protein JRE24_05150 [Deltaproteobacteria bacterium]|nr:hypothetical protein [Deltaproteobacteria bacterium]
MEETYAQRMEQLIGSFPEGSKCHKRDVENLCKARDIGMDSFVLCLEEKPFECISSVCFARSWYCSCPPRVHIAKELKK